MTGPCFVDANVFVYASDPRDASKQRRANEWLDLLWRERSGRTSTQALSEAYVALNRIAGSGSQAEEIWARVQKYFAWDPIAVDSALLRLAREIERRHRISWWDSLIVAAAQAQDCEILLTEDLQDGGVYRTVTARNPFTLEARQSPAPYAPLPVFANLHRPRGRPRRKMGSDPVLR